MAQAATMLPCFLLRLNHMERYNTVTLYVHLAVNLSVASLWEAVKRVAHAYAY